LKRALQINPDNMPGVWEDIKDWRERHKRLPVNTALGLFDADEAASENFKGMIEEFDLLPTLSAESKLTWKRADNSYIALSKSELAAVYSELKTARAVRGAVLHAKAEQFRLMPTIPTPAQLSDISFWMT